LTRYQHYLDGITLIPSGGGVFEVTAGDELIYSKKQTGRHADPASVAARVGQLLGQ
jgi:selenoprotein W-related protein